MKKIIALALTSAMLLSITACGNSQSSSQVASENATKVVSATEEETTVELTTAAQEAKMVNLPKSIVGDDFSLDVTDEDKQKGIISKTENGDYYTVEIDGSLYIQLIDSLKKSTSESLDSIPKNEAYKSIDRVEYNDNFDEIKIYVDKAVYDKNKLDNMSMFAAGIAGLLYQEYYYADDNSKCKTVVSIVDKDSNEELNKVTYPDDLSK